ncbi:MAG: LCP family protein, partial [Turicibacter sp.]|nr:LCP family protein [Turicibacter sp.]
ALFGVDSRDDAYTNTRSDAMMIFSFNNKTNQVYLSSVVRDTYAYINETYGFEKINHAYAYGGPSLAVQAINQNFDLDIQKYVTVNFNAVEHIINKLGGVELDIQDYELDELNRVIAEMNVEVSGEEASLLDDIGVQTLNGRQTVAYMRIRKIGNGDYERMERQRRVITLVAKKALSLNKIKLVGLVNDFLPYIQTNLTTSEIISLGTQLLLGGTREIEQLQLPTTSLSYETRLADGLYYLVPMTLEDVVMDWHEKVYNLDSYSPTSHLLELNKKIINYTGIY